MSGTIHAGVCGDCGHTIQFGQWPFACGTTDPTSHIIYGRLAFRPSGSSPDYAPPMPINPISKPEVTRDWMSADGTLTPMAPGSWDKNNLPEFAPGVKA